MKKIEFTGYTKDGNVFFRNQKQVSKDILQSGWTEFEVTIEKKSKHRSTQQNRWWWSCITILSNHLGYSKDQMHEICKYKFLKRELVDEKTGEVFEYLKSTTDLTTTEFSVLIESLIQWSAETFNCVLPYPNEQITLL
jgi:hypothetical protein